VIDAIAQTPDPTKWGNTPDLLNKTLVAMSPTFVRIRAAIQSQLNLLPPSGAIAGVYTMVDELKGVWKAPANVSLNDVVSPAVNISAADQKDLNVAIQGKSINAIRSFPGVGTLVWGARTLDGNSVDWRYINVRRTMIMLEQSIKFATKAYVFENNVSATWVTIKSIIQNFLTSVWKRGGAGGHNSGTRLLGILRARRNHDGWRHSGRYPEGHCCGRCHATGGIHRDYIPAADAEVVGE
jgi:uncharacterized protein